MPDTHVHDGARIRAPQLGPAAPQLITPRPAAPSPFHASLDTPLLTFGGEPWTWRSAVTGTVILGSPGRGKSSSSAKQIRRALFRAGAGGVLLAHKTDEARSLIADIKEEGRASDLVVIDASARERFNILDFAAAELGGPGFEGNLVEVMRRMSEAARVAGDQSAKDNGENSFFVDGAMKWVANAFPLLLVAEGTIRLADLNKFIASLPGSKEELTSAEWKAGYCSQVHQAASEKSKENSEAGRYALRVVNDHGAFFLKEVPKLDNRPRSSIAATLTNLIYPFLSGKLAELFTTHTTITPHDCRDGKLILLDLPPLKYGPMGAVAQSLFKYLFGVAMQNHPATDATRPCMLYADEYQAFMSSSDAEMLATFRSAKVATVFITQDQPTFFSKLGEQGAKALLEKFGFRIYHGGLSHETNVAAAELCGKVQKFHVGETRGTARNAGGGGNQQDGFGGFQAQDGKSASWSQTSSGYLDYEVPPVHFATKLRTGTKAHNYKVDAIVVRGDRVWKRTGKHWLQAEFSQR